MLVLCLILTTITVSSLIHTDPIFYICSLEQKLQLKSRALTHWVSFHCTTFQPSLVWKHRRILITLKFRMCQLKVDENTIIVVISFWILKKHQPLECKWMIIHMYGWKTWKQDRHTLCTVCWGDDQSLWFDSRAEGNNLSGDILFHQVFSHALDIECVI